MKKVSRILFLALVVTALCVAAVGAAGEPAPTTGGIYDAKAADSVTNVTLTPDGTASAVTIGDATVDDFYEGAVKVTMNYTGAADGKQYMVLVLEEDAETAIPTQDNIVYLNQAAADSSGVSFELYPSALNTGKTYTVCVTNSDDGTVTKVGTFKYYQPYIPGDANGDKTVDALDAMECFKHYVRNITLTGDNFKAADVNGDNVVDVRDGMEILNMCVGNSNS